MLGGLESDTLPTAFLAIGKVPGWVEGLNRYRGKGAGI